MAASKGGHILQALKQISEHLSTTKRYDRMLRNVRVISAEPGRCVCQVKVEEEHLNGVGTMHGGFTSTLIDCITTYALLATDAGSPGVSVNLNVSFLKAAKPGEEVTIDAKVLRQGRTLAFTEALLTNSDGVTIAKGEHVKYMGVKLGT